MRERPLSLNKGGRVKGGVCHSYVTSSEPGRLQQTINSLAMRRREGEGAEEGGGIGERAIRRLRQGGVEELSRLGDGEKRQAAGRKRHEGVGERGRRRRRRSRRGWKRRRWSGGREAARALFETRQRSS